MYTSGTSAHPKGCRLSHEAVVRTAAAMVRALRAHERGRLVVPAAALPHERRPAARGDAARRLPLRVHGRLRAGGRPPSDRAGAGDVPLRHLPDGEPGARRPSRPGDHRPELRAAHEHPGHDASAGGAPRRTPEREPPPRLRLHGARRHRVAHGPGDAGRRARADLGHAMAGMQVRIVDPESGDDVATGARGEISRGAGACSRDTSPAPDCRPSQASTPLDEDGWFHTGDWGSLDELGRIGFHGRLKDMLKIGGENVAPSRSSRSSRRIPPSASSRSWACPTTTSSRSRPRSSTRARRRATEAELIAFCRGAIASYKIPRYVRFVDEWPMSGHEDPEGEAARAAAGRARGRG